MTDEVIPYRFRVRGGTAANLAAVNEVPLARELIVETDTGKMKLGDGMASYLQLPYVGAAGGGAIWRSGSGTPSDALGHDGDFYLDADTGDVYERADGTYALVANISGPRGSPGDRGPAGPPGPASSAYFGATFDGGNVEIAPGSFCDVRVPYGCRLTRVSVVADRIGRLVVGVWSVPWAQFPATPADSITGASPPSLFTQIKYESTDFSDWRDEIESGEVIRFYVSECEEIRRATILLEGIRE